MTIPKKKMKEWIVRVDLTVEVRARTKSLAEHRADIALGKLGRLNRFVKVDDWDVFNVEEM